MTPSPFSTLRRSALVLASSLLLGGAAWAQDKVIFQVSDADPAKWNLTLNNIRNVQQDLGADKVDVEIVAYGPGIADMLGNISYVPAGVVELMRKQQQGWAYIRP